MFALDLGLHRIIYKAAEFQSGVTITGYLWSPSLTKSAQQVFTEIGDGLYYLDFDFTAEGAWPILLYEDGIKVGFAVMRIGISHCEAEPPKAIRATVLLA